MSQTSLFLFFLFFWFVAGHVCVDLPYIQEHPRLSKHRPNNDRRTEKGRSPLSPTSSVIRHVANIRHFNPDPKPQFMTINNKMIIYTENGFAKTDRAAAWTRGNLLLRASACVGVTSPSASVAVNSADWWKTSRQNPVNVCLWSTSNKKKRWKWVRDLLL